MFASEGGEDMSIKLSLLGIVLIVISLLTIVYYPYQKPTTIPDPAIDQMMLMVLIMAVVLAAGFILLTRKEHEPSRM